MKKTASLCNGIPGPTDCAGTIASRELHHSVASMTFHPMKALYPVLIKIICLPVLAAFCQSATGVPGSVNLLHGDVSFELGAYGWEAHTGPWKSTELDNNYRAKGLRDGSAEGVIDTSSPYRGKAALRLQLAPESRSYVTASLPVDLDPGRYTLSAFVRCSETTRVQLRTVLEYPAGKEGGQNDFYDAHARSESKAGTEWRRATLSFDIKTRTRLVPVIDFFGARGQCWTDDVALVDGAHPAADPLLPRAGQTIALIEDVPSPMRNLLFASGVNDQKVVEIAVTTLVPASKAGEARIELWVQAADSEARQSGSKTVLLNAGSAVRTVFPVPVTAYGIWRIEARTMLPDNSRLTTETVVASIIPSLGKPDSFFGAHQKLSPLISFLGYGSIRDMHLLKWSAVMPTSDRIAPPPRDELIAIQRFVEGGGRYLATLVSENPARIGYNATHWGSDGDFGGVPSWADAGRDTEPGVLGQRMRAVKPAALGAYAAYVGRNFPFLDFEFMNEPLHYLTPTDYARLLEVGYLAIKKENPEATVVAFGNPPNWFKLPGGRDARFRSPTPSAWFDEAFAAGAGNHMDVIGLHTYDRNLKNETPESGYGGGQAAWASSIRSVAEKYRTGLPVWITEKGISSSSWRTSRQFRSGRTNHQVSSALTQARWLVRSQLDARVHGIERFFIWNEPWGTGATHRYFPNEDVRYTLFDSDGLPRPALVAQRVLIEQLSHLRAVDHGEPRPGLRYALFSAEDGSAVAALWHHGQNERDELAGAASEIRCPTLPQGTVSVTLYGERNPYMCVANRMKVTPSPVYLRIPDIPDDATLKALFKTL